MTDFLKQTTLAVFTLMLTSSLYGQLTWEKNLVKDDASFTDERTVAEFPFINETDETITITKIESTCACTLGELEDRVIEPGESGILRATFDYGSRSGPQHKVITVHTDSEAQPRKMLTIEVDIPILLTIKPGYVFWRKGNTPEPQEAVITLHSPRATIKSVTPSDALEVSLTPVEDNAEATGKQYLLTVQPKSTEANAAGRVDIIVNYADTYDKNFLFHAHVK